MPRQKKIYLNENYKEITLGSAENVKTVHTDIVPETGVKQYYVWGTEADREFCENHGYLFEAAIPQEPEYDPFAAEKDVARDPTEYVGSDTQPEKFYCEKHACVHEKGDTEYYTCVEDWLNSEPPTTPEEDEEAINEAAEQAAKEQAEEDAKKKAEEDAKKKAEEDKTASTPDESSEVVVDQEKVEKALKKPHPPVYRAIAQLDQNKETLEAAVAFEKANRGRKGVLSNLDKRIQALG